MTLTREGAFQAVEKPTNNKKCEKSRGVYQPPFGKGRWARVKRARRDCINVAKQPPYRKRRRNRTRIKIGYSLRSDNSCNPSVPVRGQLPLHKGALEMPCLFLIHLFRQVAKRTLSGAFFTAIFERRWAGDSCLSALPPSPKESVRFVL